MINKGRTQPAFEFRGQNPVNGAIIDFYLNAEVDSVEIEVSEPGTGRSRISKIGVKQGLNRAYWNFRLNYTDADVATYKDELATVIKELQGRVDDKALKKKLSPIEKKLKKTTSIRELNVVRSRLVKDFNGYAGGKSFFGEKRMPISAGPGTYKIELVAGDQKLSGEIKVRADPLLSN
jgi:hypothetical protein